MILAIFGYTKTGKTLLFNLLTDKNEEISKFSSKKNELHKAVSNVPDDRLKSIAKIYNTPPVYAKIEYLDTGSIAYGNANSSAFLDILRRSDGLIHVARAFEDNEILHPKDTIDPIRDINNMIDELKTTDFFTIEKRLEKLEIDRKKIKSDLLDREYSLLKKLKDKLEAGIALKDVELSPEEVKMIRGFSFLSLKPLINLINTDDNSYKEMLQYEQKFDNTYVFSAKIEKELLELDSEERPIFEEEFGMKNYQYLKETFKNKCYKSMGLISFFTVGSDETKAWTIPKNSTAYLASGKIHSDIQQGFIRAEVIEWEKLLESNGFTEAKKKGHLRLEGKEYIVQDGEIVHFRFNK